MSHPDVWRRGDPMTPEIAELEQGFNLMFRALEETGALSQDPATGAWVLDAEKLAISPSGRTSPQSETLSAAASSTQPKRSAETVKSVSLRPEFSLG